MKLAVVGLGLVSPAGLTSTENVFFVRAGGPPPRPSPFMLASGDPAPVAFCPWIGARAPLGERLGRLAVAALYEATLPLDDGRALDLGQAPLFVCTSGPRPGLGDADRAGVEALAARRLGGAAPTRLEGEASAFAALSLAGDLLAGGAARAAVVLAVDSFVSAARLADRLARAPSPYAERPLTPAEGAAALVVMDPAAAEELGVPAIGRVLFAGTAQGTSTDDDDEIVDGAALTRLLRAAPASAPIGAAFGQLEVDALRQTEWLLAAARAASRLDPEHESRCLEGEIGAVGAASGAMSLAYALALLRHGAARSERAARAPFAAWAVSRDGARGLALAEVAS